MAVRKSKPADDASCMHTNKGPSPAVCASAGTAVRARNSGRSRGSMIVFLVHEYTSKTGLKAVAPRLVRQNVIRSPESAGGIPRSYRPPERQRSAAAGNLFPSAHLEGRAPRCPTRLLDPLRAFLSGVRFPNAPATA